MSRPHVNDVDWHSIFTYDDGELYWKKRFVAERMSPVAGKKVGVHMRTNGYRYVRINRKGKRNFWDFVFHHIVAVMHGINLREGEIDHINGDRNDNRIENLRLVDRTTNNYNAKKRKGTSRYLGVSFASRDRAWVMQLTHKSQCINRSWHKDECEAARAYDRAKSKHLLRLGEDPLEFRRGFNFPDELAVAPLGVGRGEYEEIAPALHGMVQ